MVRGVAVLLALWSADALRVVPIARPAVRGITRHAPICASDAETGATTKVTAADASSSATITVAANDANASATNATVPVTEGNFMKWYRREKMIEKYKKENPTDAFEGALAKLQRRASPAGARAPPRASAAAARSASAPTSPPRALR